MILLLIVSFTPLCVTASPSAFVSSNGSPPTPNISASNSSSSLPVDNLLPTLSGVLTTHQDLPPQLAGQRLLHCCSHPLGLTCPKHQRDLQEMPQKTPPHICYKLTNTLLLPIDCFIFVLF